MKFDYTTRLTSSMSAATLNSTVLASMAELLAVIDGATKTDRVNFHPMARFKAGQFGTIDGDRISLAADGLGIPTEGLKDGAADAAADASASIGHRAFATEEGQRGTRGLMGGTKTGILRGHTYVAIAGGASSGTVTIDWTNAGPAQTDADEAIPAGWTGLTLERVMAAPAHNEVDAADPNFSLWIHNISAGHEFVASACISASPGATGFTLKAERCDWDTTAHTSSLYTTGTSNLYFSWIALVKHA